MGAIRLSITSCEFFHNIISCPKSISQNTLLTYSPLKSVCDKTVRYVAEENIKPVDPHTLPSEALMRLAGRHFKRWDPANRVFVSNLREEYPDD